MSSRTVAGAFVTIPPWASWRARVATLREGLRSARHAVETRRTLGELDAHVLADIGVSRVEAEWEAGRAPWDLTPMRPRSRVAKQSPGWLIGAGLSPGPVAVPPLFPRHAYEEHRKPWHSATSGGQSSWRKVRSHGVGVRAWIAEALRRRRSRQAISALDTFLLKDIGVSYAEAEYEANKPFWR